MVSFIPTPIGNSKDITLRALEHFQDTTLFLCENIINSKKLMRIFESRFQFKYPSADFLSLNEHNFNNRITSISNRLKSETISYISDAGMPSISDPGQQLVLYCQLNKIPYDVLAGADALTTSYVASGFEDVNFTFNGFLPNSGRERGDKLIKIMDSEINTILYESPHRLLKLINEISLLDKDRILFLGKELTKKFQSYFKNSAENLLIELNKENIRGEWVVIIEGIKKKKNWLFFDEVMNFDLPPKIKSKLLAKISDKTSKEWYQFFIEKR